MDRPSFAQLLARIRAGDPAAAAAVVERFGVQIRAAVRARFGDPRLRRVLDTSDVCQSVLTDFFAAVALGQFDLDDSRAAVRLLARMARNKMVSAHRFHTQDRRDVRRLQSVGSSVRLQGTPVPAADRIAAGRELLRLLRAGLTPEEAAVADRRGVGQSWVEIAADLGGTADGRRKQLTRALARVGPQYGLDALGTPDE